MFVDVANTIVIIDPISVLEFPVLEFVIVYSERFAYISVCALRNPFLYMGEPRIWFIQSMDFSARFMLSRSRFFLIETI